MDYWRVKSISIRPQDLMRHLCELGLVPEDTSYLKMWVDYPCAGPVLRVSACSDEWPVVPEGEWVPELSLLGA